MHCAPLAPRCSAFWLRSFAVAAVAAGLTTACKKPAQRQEPPAEVRAVASSIAALEAPPPEAPSVPLAQEIERFSTLEDCRSRHQEQDPVLGDALDALGYEVLVDDACLALDALKTRETARCGGLQSSTLRLRCLRDVAIVRKEGALCPLAQENDRRSGRDPLCVALAEGAYVACTGLRAYAEKTGCEAATTGEAIRCEPLGKTERSRCERLVRRFSGLGTRGVATLPPRSRGTITLEALEGSTPLYAFPENSAPSPASRTDGSATDGDAGAHVEGETTVNLGTSEGASPEAQRRDPLEAFAGAVLSAGERGGFLTDGGASADRQELVLGRFRHGGMTTTYVAPANGRMRLALALTLARAGTPAEVGALELELPGRTTFVYEKSAANLSSRFEGTATVTPADRLTVGGPVRVHLEGKVGVVPNEFRVKIDLETWLRDQVP
jgi:hypothetical protein